jgi:anti-sigma regulatory factor (Ser/Thr protein kinase)
MNTEVTTIYEDEPLVHAVDKLEQFGFGRLPVISRKSGDLVGIITKGNIIEGILNKLETEYHEEEIHQYRASHIFEDIIADETCIVLEYNIKGGSFDEAGEKSSNLKKTMKRLGIKPEVVRKLAIASYEAEMNLVIYANGGKMVYKITPGNILGEIKDQGPGIPDIEKAMEPGFSTASDRIRELGFGAGLGLPNIKKCSDKMELTSKVGVGTNLKFKMAF